MVSHLLGFRARLLAYAVAAVGLILGAPRLQGTFVDFARTPGGLALGAGILVVAGLSVEESGTMPRIRLGILMRLAGPLVLAVAAAGAMAQGAGPGLLFAVGGLFVGHGVYYDLRVLQDLRYGQAVRVEELSAKELRLRAKERSIIVPLDALAGAAPIAIGSGRATQIVVSRPDRIQGDTSALPAYASESDADAFLLTEHQCNRDARAFSDALNRAIREGAKGYR